MRSPAPAMPAAGFSVFNAGFNVELAIEFTIRVHHSSSPFDPR
jgi:hypothetical protein